ncbi:hypothetical protein BDW66DRAFT_155904 [Aspergillus desertorum]
MTNTTAGGASAPTPTQPGAVCACKTRHKVVSGNTCGAIQKQYAITAANFKKWDPQACLIMTMRELYEYE